MTDPLTPERLGEIRALAEAATPGEWFTDHAREVCAMLGGISPVLIAETGTSGELVVEQSEADAAFIALGPKTTLSLLDALDVAERERDAARNERDAAEARADEDANRSSDAIVRWCVSMADIREASGVGVKPMLDEVPAAIKARVAALESRATAAEARVAELEGLLREAGEVVDELLRHSIAHYGHPNDEEYGVGLHHARARAILAQGGEA